MSKLISPRYGSYCTAYATSAITAWTIAWRSLSLSFSTWGSCCPTDSNNRVTGQNSLSTINCNTRDRTHVDACQEMIDDPCTLHQSMALTFSSWGMECVTCMPLSNSPTRMNSNRLSSTLYWTPEGPRFSSSRNRGPFRGLWTENNSAHVIARIQKTATFTLVWQ